MAEDLHPTAPRAEIAELVAAHYRALYAYAFRLSGSVADAEDLVQQVFLIAQQKSHQVRDSTATRGWLFTVLRNCFLKDRRRAAPQLAGNLDMNLDTWAATVPEELWFDGERLQAAIEQLPPQYKIVLMLFYFEQCSYREIAEKLNIPNGTVMSRLARAKIHLRTGLAEGEHGMTAAADRLAKHP